MGKSNKLLAHIEDVSGDGFDDLVVQIEEGAHQLRRFPSSVVDQRVLDLALSGSTSFHVSGYDVL